MSDDLDIVDFLPAHVWVAEKGGPIFDSMAKFDWLRRRYRNELVASGHFISGTGRRGDLCGPGLGKVILQILRREGGAA